jgi:type I restriction enzyme S subunit
MREGYKDSVLGEIPEDWEIIAIEYIGEIVSGGTPKTGIKEYWDGDIKWITPTDVTALKGLKFIEKTKRTISLDGLKSSSANMLPVKSLIVCTRATIGDSVINNVELSTNQGFKSLIPKSNFNTEYLYYVITSIKSLLIKLSSGSTFLELSTKAFKKIELPLPPLPEQQKIASILSTVDDKIEVIDQQIATTQQLKKGLMQRLLTKGIGHTEFKHSELGEIPKSWEVTKIKNVLKIGSGKDYKHLDPGEIPVFGTGGYMTSVNEYLYDGDSVGIGRKGTIDKPVFLQGKFWTVDTLFYTHSFENIIPYYVYLVFQTINWRSLNEATGVPSLSKPIIENVRFFLPPIPEQQKIATILNTVDDKLEVLTDKKCHYQELKKGLMQQLLTGKVRVRV